MKQPDRKVVLSIGAHPDDAEFLCAGTLALLQAQGWEVHIATLTPSDKGTAAHSREEISQIRRGKGQQAANVLNGEYHCLECADRSGHHQSCDRPDTSDQAFCCDH